MAVLYSRTYKWYDKDWRINSSIAAVDLAFWYVCHGLLGSSFENSSLYGADHLVSFWTLPVSWRLVQPPLKVEERFMNHTYCFHLFVIFGAFVSWTVLIWQDKTVLRVHNVGAFWPTLSFLVNLWSYVFERRFCTLNFLLCGKKSSL